MTDEKQIGTTPPNEPTSEGALPRPVVKRRRFNASLIWLIPALAAVAPRRTPVRHALRQFLGERAAAGRVEAAGLVRPRQIEAAGLLRGYLDALDLGQKG